MYVDTLGLRAGMMNREAVTVGTDVYIPAMHELSRADIIKIFCLRREGCEVLLPDAPVEQDGLDIGEADRVLRDITGSLGVRPYLASLMAYDGTTYAHSLAVAALSVVVGRKAGLDRESVIELGTAAILHDVGKECIPREIITKPGKLSEEETETVRTHPGMAYDLLRPSVALPAPVKRAVYEHHENEDGSGYPRHLKGSDICEYSKIIHVCDVYDALTSYRPYRLPMTSMEALNYLRMYAGRMFSSKHVDIVIDLCR